MRDLTGSFNVRRYESRVVAVLILLILIFTVVIVLLIFRIVASALELGHADLVVKQGGVVSVKLGASAGQRCVPFLWSRR
jgi:hypothetical protein